MAEPVHTSESAGTLIEAGTARSVGYPGCRFTGPCSALIPRNTNVFAGVAIVIRAKGLRSFDLADPVNATISTGAYIPASLAGFTRVLLADSVDAGVLIGALIQVGIAVFTRLLLDSLADIINAAVATGTWIAVNPAGVAGANNCFRLTDIFDANIFTATLAVSPAISIRGSILPGWARNVIVTLVLITGRGLVRAFLLLSFAAPGDSFLVTLIIGFVVAVVRILFFGVFVSSHTSHSSSKDGRKMSNSVGIFVGFHAGKDSWNNGEGRYARYITATQARVGIIVG